MSAPVPLTDRVRTFLSDLVCIHKAHPDWSPERALRAAGIDGLTQEENIEAARYVTANMEQIARWEVES